MSFTLPITASKRRGWRKPAFTLIEMMVAMAILTILMIIVFEIVNSTTKVWKSTSNKMNVFQGARAGFEAMTRNLSQATLQTYLDYANSSGMPVTLFNPSFTAATVPRNLIPAYYLRASDLHFVTDDAKNLFNRASVTNTTTGQAAFFQAPTGVGEKVLFRANDSTLNNYGYYLEYGPSVGPDNINRSAEDIKLSNRYRLMEVIQPAEKNFVYQSTSKPSLNSTYTYDLDWIKNMNLTGTASSAHPIADNVIALVINCKLSATDEAKYGVIAPKYSYDSRSWENNYTGNSLQPSAADPSSTAIIGNSLRNQLPPLVEVIMVCIDETSAQRLARENTTPPFASGTLDISNLFTQSSQLETDLSSLEKKLRDNRINYRIFLTTVPIQAAKWSN